MPVAIFENMRPFTNNMLYLQKGDCLYLATDGFVDQFGGPHDKKFKMNQLKENLSTICDKMMNEQLETLESLFERWKGSRLQTDDVTILGIRV